MGKVYVVPRDAPPKLYREFKGLQYNVCFMC